MLLTKIFVRSIDCLICRHLFLPPWLLRGPVPLFCDGKSFFCYHVCLPTPAHTTLSFTLFNKVPGLTLSVPSFNRAHHRDLISFCSVPQLLCYLFFWPSLVHERFTPAFGILKLCTQAFRWPSKPGIFLLVLQVITLSSYAEYTRPEAHQHGPSNKKYSQFFGS